MTNEQKARELCMAIEPPYIDFIQQNYKTALQAMQWKDEQHNEEKRDLLELVKMLKIDEQNQTIIGDLVAILNS